MVRTTRTHSFADHGATDGEGAAAAGPIPARVEATPGAHLRRLALGAALALSGLALPASIRAEVEVYRSVDESGVERYIIRQTPDKAATEPAKPRPTPIEETRNGDPADTEEAPASVPSRSERTDSGAKGSRPVDSGPPVPPVSDAPVSEPDEEPDDSESGGSEPGVSESDVSEPSSAEPVDAQSPAPVDAAQKLRGPEPAPSDASPQEPSFASAVAKAPVVLPGSAEDIRAQIERDREALRQLLSQPGGNPLDNRNSERIREIAERLPRLQAELEALEIETTP